MTLTIRIETDNAAFADAEGTYEAARILRRLASDIEAASRDDYRKHQTIHDANGNDVGRVVWK